MTTTLTDRNSPIFIAHFADGNVTRMTTWTPLDNLDLGRGVRLAHHAYRSRTGCEPPPISKAFFESTNGTRLATYDADTLAKARP